MAGADAAREDGGGTGSAAERIAAMRPLLLRLAQLQLRNEAWAQDAVSETLLAALEGQQRYRGSAQLRTWVVGILKHKIIDQLRRNQRELALDADAESQREEPLDALFRADGHRVAAPLDWGDPEEQATRGQFFAVLQACLERLPAPLARAFLLREWMEWETAEICKELRVSPTNCFVMLYRARLRLRECLDVHWFASPGGISHG